VVAWLRRYTEGIALPPWRAGGPSGASGHREKIAVAGGDLPHISAIACDPAR